MWEQQIREPVPIYVLGQWSSPRGNPSSAVRGTPPRPDIVEDKGNGPPLRVTLWVIPWNKISTKTENDNGKNGDIYGKSCHYGIKCSVPTEPCFLAFTTTPNNFGERLMGQVSAL